MFNHKNTEKKNGLRIIIVGCGKVGTTLVEQLLKEGHDITIVDTNPQKIQAITNLYDVMGLAGNGASYGVLMEAGIESTDLIIAVTESDELNLLCCTVAKRVANCAAICRVRTPDYSKEVDYLRDKLELAMIINPEQECALEAARILCMPTALEVDSFAHGQAELIKFMIPRDSILDGLTLAEMSHTVTSNVLVCAIERDGEVTIPSGSFRMKQGDILSFVASRAGVKAFMESMGIKSNHVKDTMIIGGGRAAYYLAKLLINMGISVKIIEQNVKRCEELSLLLPKAIIINGDGTDEDLLKEEGIEYTESFVPLTGIDEENILMTLHAKSVSHAKVITKINRITFKTVINDLNLGSVIYPRFITSEAIIAYVRAKKNSMECSNIETLSHMFDGRAEAIEFRIEEPSAVTDTPLHALKLKKNLLIAFINRDGHIILPSGNDCIMAGDTVMIVTVHSGFNNINDILQ